MGVALQVNQWDAKSKPVSRARCLSIRSFDLFWGTKKHPNFMGRLSMDKNDGLYLIRG